MCLYQPPRKARGQPFLPLTLLMLADKVALATAEEETVEEVAGVAVALVLDV